MSPPPNHRNPRLRCECCGYPTIRAALDRYDTFEPWAMSWACVLCDWENAPLLSDGSPDPEARTGEERNGGFTLARAQANVHAHAWMYDPAQLEPWMVAPPSEDELALRRALRDAYEELGTTPNEYDLWRRIEGHEDALRDLAIRRAQSAAGEVDPPVA